MNTDGANITGIIKLVVDAINATKKFDPIDLQIGQEEVTSFDETPSIYWRPLYDDGYRGAHDQPDDAQAYLETTTVCEVKVWGTDLTEAERLRTAVLITAHVLFSPNAEQPIGRGDYSKGLSTGERGVMLTFHLGFVVPLLYEEFTTALIQYVNDNPGLPFTSGITVTDAQGLNPEDLPP